MEIEQHINNLKKYIEEDFAFREPIKNMSDFDRYCWNHCKDIETLLTAYEKEKEKNKELNWKYTASWVDEHFVSKDKIRLKMKQEMDKGYRLSEERHLQNYAYDRLKELLEE